MLRRDLLQRFRPIGAPGTTADVGVPGAAEDRADAELAAVFAALRPTVEECRAALERADAEAADELAAADQDADALRRTATAEADTARREAMEDVRRDSETRTAALLAEAGTEADRILARGRAAMPALVARVVSRVGDLGDPGALS